jgi:Tetracyclin repressor-like, C-terminal domain
MQREMMRAREGRSVHIERLVKTYFQPIYRRVGELLHKGIDEGEFRNVDTAHFVPSMVAIIVFYFSSAPVMQKILRFDPLAPKKVSERRAAVLDFISAALFLPSSSVAPAIRKSGVRK